MLLSLKKVILCFFPFSFNLKYARYFRSEITYLYFFLSIYLLIEWLFHIYEFYFVFCDFCGLWFHCLVTTFGYVSSSSYNVLFLLFYLFVGNSDRQNIFDHT